MPTTLKVQRANNTTFIYAEDENNERYRIVVTDDKGMAEEWSGMYLDDLDAEIPDNVTVSENKVEC